MRSLVSLALCYVINQTHDDPCKWNRQGTLLIFCKDLNSYRINWWWLSLLRDFMRMWFEKKAKNNPSEATSYIEMKAREENAVLWNIYMSFSILLHVPCGLVVRIRRSHRRGRGSIPRTGAFSIKTQSLILFICLCFGLNSV